MRQPIPTNGFDADLAALIAGDIVTLHTFPDGFVLLWTYDAEIPTAEGLDATGYVWRVADSDGQWVDIYDWITWTDPAAVKAKYDAVMAKAKSE